MSVRSIAKLNTPSNVETDSREHVFFGTAEMLLFGSGRRKLIKEQTSFAAKTIRCCLKNGEGGHVTWEI